MTATAQAAAPAAAGKVSPPPQALPEMLRPLTPEPTGRDPRYGERFEAVQAEVARLAGTDFPLIVEGCRGILCDEAKDLRVLGYLALGQLGAGGVSGFAEALEITAALISQFAGELHPRREAAQAAALGYLESERMIALLERAPDAGDPAARARLDEALTALSKAAEQAGDLPPLPLGRLRQWWHRTTPSPASPPAVPIADPGAVVPAQPPAASRPAPSGGITDDAAFHATMRQALGFLREQGRWGEHAGLARAYRWCALVAPSAEAGVTRVEPPRASALAAIHTAMAEQRWADALLAAERAFLEPGGQWCLGIQRLAAGCAAQLGDQAALAAIEGGVQALCRRLPMLSELAFRDGTPFVSAEDQAWLAPLMVAPAPAGAASEPEPAPEGGALAAAREQVAGEGLGAALQSLEQGAGAGRGMSRRCALQAQLCLEQRRPDVARPLLEGALDAMRRGGHDLWDPELTAQLLRLALTATGRDSGLPAAERRRRLAALRDQLTRLDPVSALGRDAGADPSGR